MHLLELQQKLIDYLGPEILGVVICSVLSVVGGYNGQMQLLSIDLKLKMNTESNSYIPSRFKSHFEFGWDVSQKRFAMVS